MRLGEFEVEIVSGGRFRLDGGGMFGVIPQVLWSRVYQPDERGRIQLDANCLLVRTPDELVLIDTGNGTKFSAKEQAIYDLQPGDTLLANLAALGVRPEEITTVLLTHLHMDHVGGASRFEGEETVVEFPNARFVVQRVEWEDAVANRSHMRISYRPENLAPLERSGRLELLDGDTEVLPGIHTHLAGGHTRAHQSVFLRSQGETLFYPADLCPTPAHVRPAYNMGYDMVPYDNLVAKGELFPRAAEEGWLLVFDHAPEQKAARLRYEAGQVSAEPVSFT